jgi:hypothetical protein
MRMKGKDNERKRLQLKIMNEDGREEHRIQNRDQVRTNQQRQWRGFNKVIKKIESTTPWKKMRKNGQ